MSERRAQLLGTWWLYLTMALPAFVGSLPLATLFGGVWGQHGAGEARLWEAGGEGLLEALRLVAPGLGATLRAEVWLLPAWGLLAVVVQALVMAILAREASGGARLARATSSVGRLVGVGLATLLARVVVGLLGLALARALDASLGREREMGRAVAWAVVGLLGLGVVGLVRVVQDVAAAAVVGRGERVGAALLTGLEVLHRRTGEAVGAWAWRAALGVGVLAAAAAVGRGTIGLALLGTAVVHQAALFAAAWWRVAWWRQALALAGPGASEPDGQTMSGGVVVSEGEGRQAHDP